MPQTTRASVAYKKKDGSLSVADDRKYLFWTPAAPPGASPSVTVPVADITNLQQTPESSPKVALKVFVKEESYVFSFTAAREQARKEQESVTDILRDTIANAKAKDADKLAPPAAAAAPGTPAQDGGDSGQSAAMTFAKAVSAREAEDAWYDDGRLKNDFQLQRSLLTSNKALNDRFTQSLREKPETVTVPQFTAQFWSTRLHLLRAHAIEKAQKEGEYNVLPEIKHTSVLGEDGQYHKTLNVTKEQIGLLFKQYPIVRRAFDECTPKLKPEEFWARFFGSRLLKKLKGERIERTDPPDGVLDRYLDEAGNVGPIGLGHSVPHVIDLEGNEQNTKFRVNREGWEMSASRHDQPILHVLNNLSEKMMSHVAANDNQQAHAPIGLDEETFEQLQLRDLAMNDVDNRVVLNVRDQQQYLAGQREDDLSKDARLYATQDPSKVLSSLQSDLLPSHLGSDDKGTLRLDRAIGYHTDDESDSEDESASAPQTNGATAKPKSRIGSHASLTTATSSVLNSIQQRRHHASASSTPTAASLGLSQTLLDQLTITHNTTTEFLHYFWTLFLSGDPSKSTELQGLVSTLDRSVDRINAVAEQAEAERQKKLDVQREKVKEYEKRTGKRRRVDERDAGSGKAGVEVLVRPTVEALRAASEAYRKAWEEQSKDAGLGGGTPVPGASAAAAAG
ncbi:hypothetical protein D0867_09365 [Hortaea werneckii]|uniref:BSD domain-containing protein n=1 Tax=Hortaea werneckii TaxID=91943 RepID=A0A3M6YWW1_HORWE|nr:hypothetical protein KC355_g5351 [Hortaea werneckii]RMY07387.1 hypothetical protein D0867_09365 [Hortaea werneckii]RMY25734.1 hypothetical protein D0866_11034 [Hortaea werneckii]